MGVEPILREEVLADGKAQAASQGGIELVSLTNKAWSP